MTEQVHPSPRALDEHATGGAPELAAHVAQCARCAAYLTALDDERQALLTRWPAPRFVAALAARRDVADRRARRRRWVGGAGAALACAAAVAVWLVPRAPDGVRAKGLGLEIYRKRGEQVEPLAEADRVRGGDGLRISLTLPSAQRVALSFVDARGHVDPYEDRELPAGTSLLPGVTIDDPCVDLRLVITTGGGVLERAIACE